MCAFLHESSTPAYTSLKIVLPATLFATGPAWVHNLAMEGCTMSQYHSHNELDPGPSRYETIVGISAAVLTLAMFGGLMMLFS